MNIHYGFEQLPSIKNPIVTSGTFDGVHIGHRKILNRLNEIAQNNDGNSVVITFWPHPRYVLGKNKDDFKLLSSLDEKIQLIASQNIDHLIIVPFTLEFSELSSSQFIATIICDQLKTQKLVIGYDHKFGKNREGSFDYLKENQNNLGFEIEEIPREDIDSIGISSTNIRLAIENGDVLTANKQIGSNYSIEGKVVKGQQLGRTIGYPTANIQIEEPNKLIPKNGVYVVEVELKNSIFTGMLNIGNRPTVNGLTTTIEVHIFDFNEDIYEQSIRIIFIDRLRDEIKFNSLEDLKNQLTLDKINSTNRINQQ